MCIFDDVGYPPDDAGDPPDNAGDSPLPSDDVHLAGEERCRGLLAEDNQLPEGWQAYTDPHTLELWYHNTKTDVSTWVKPPPVESCYSTSESEEAVSRTPVYKGVIRHEPPPSDRKPLPPPLDPPVRPYTDACRPDTGSSST